MNYGSYGWSVRHRIISEVSEIVISNAIKTREITILFINLCKYLLSHGCKHFSDFLAIVIMIKGMLKRIIFQ